MSGNEYINVVTSHPHPTPPDAPDKECQEDALKDFADFPPAVTKVIQASTWCTRWGLLLTKPLPTWNAPSHRVTLLGDSAHSMFPHMGQGAAMAIEDAAVLGRVADHVNRGHLTLTEALDIYVDVRLNRATETQERSITQGYIWQFPDGPDQQARDRAMSVELNGSHYLRTPNLWGDPRTQVLQYGYRCENHAEDEIAQHLKRKRNQYGWSGVRKHVEDHSLNWFLNDLGRRPEPATTMMAPVDSHA